MNEWNILETLTQFFHYQLFSVNQTPITPLSLFVFSLVLSIFYVLAHAIQRLLRNRILKRIDISSATQYTLIRISQYIVWVIGAILAFQFIGIDLSALAVAFGFLSVGIGFGLQNLTSNFISGIILLFEQHINVGDRVTVVDTEGNVEEINIRSTTIRSLNNVAIVVPNSEFISGTVINWSHGDPTTRLEIDVGVSYQSDLDIVIHAMLEAGKEHPEVLREPTPKVWFMGFGDSAWNMRLLVWVDNPHGRRQVQSDINCAIVRKFRENGVEIPFPQRDLHVRSPLPVPLLTTPS
jgi:small-conductance mechanosensitive channel